MNELALRAIAGLLAALNFFPVIAQTNGEVASKEDFPAIAIEFVSDESTGLIATLKLQYDACLLQRESARKARDQGGLAWEMVKQSLPSGYVVNASVNEPNWEQERVGTFTSQEYFDGDKYAHYSYKTNYSISEDGRCSLLKEPIVKIELDDTVTRYQIKYKGKNERLGSPDGETPEWLRYETQRVYRNPSPVKLRAENAARLRELSQTPAFQNVAKKMLDNRNDASCPPDGCNGIDMKGINDVKKLIITNEVNYNDAEKPGESNGKPSIIANQPVDRIESANLGSNVYYWHRAHKYPGIMGRSIVLRTETKTLMGGETIKEAYSFETADQLPDSIFQPAPGLLQRVANRSGPRDPGNVPR